MNKSRKLFALTLLTSLLVLAALNVSVLSVNAQSQATVTVLTSIGGSTDPTGTNSYADGTAVTLTATPGTGFTFLNWEIASSAGATVTSDNPATLTVTGGVTYAVQALFQPIQVPPSGIAVTNFSTAAIVVVLPATGGTTNPAAGTYALANASSLDLTATPASGWQFSHWVISGTPMNHGAYSFTAVPTDNPYNVNHGYGNTYSYQPVFIPTGTTEPTPTVPELSVISVAIIAVLLAAVALGTYAYKKKTK